MTGDTPPAMRPVPRVLAERYGAQAPKPPPPAREQERRIYPHVRGIIEAAKKSGRLRQMSALMWGAKELNQRSPPDLAVLDEAIEGRETTNDAPPQVSTRPNLNALFTSVRPEEKTAFRWFAMKLPPDKLDALEGILARSGESLPDAPKPRPRHLTPDDVQWIPDTGPPKVTRRS
jgi:hypothetical protein